ncbi:MAG: hypothetical protein RIQ60_4030 [Pseudomonadota bacterium]|jgi:hemerythrin
MHDVHFVWKPEYDVGIKDIDDQHHYFAGLINKFIAELWGTRPDEYQRQLVAELNAYARFHFISEENLMLRCSYPLLAEHRAHHLQLLDELSAKQTRLALEKTEQRKKEMVDYLIRWFINHTTKEDLLLANYLHGAPATDPA